MTLTDLSLGFRDPDQRRCAQAVIHNRLADDRDQQECRYLMRFWWQLCVPYREVTLDQLRENVGGPKLRLVEELIEAVRTSPEAIDEWIDAVENAFPVVQDRGFEAQVRLNSGLSAGPTP
ncbi:hypothetical protein ABZ016_39625 [Streptomyces sp. NPDC006372]|uniref:hypothetical protein n=1 Tax=Streptomyces sp. NPDC006372 TaxID=3155599 RepID=UPI0033A55115